MNLSPYNNATQLMYPIVLLLIPLRASHADNVPNTSNKGKPAEKPKNNMAITRGCLYFINALAHELFLVCCMLLISIIPACNHNQLSKEHDLKNVRLYKSVLPSPYL